MEERRVTVHGTGRVVLPAYGLADAEHQVEKELEEAWPGSRAKVLDVARTDDRPRIVEEFAVRYRVRGTVTEKASTEQEAKTAALRGLRERFTGTRFAGVAWDVISTEARR
ncbi:MAG TPA: hypothetical protein VF613_05255 [Longimicrobium sp.]|jgi:hypothetical protein